LPSARFNEGVPLHLFELGGSPTEGVPPASGAAGRRALERGNPPGVQGACPFSDPGTPIPTPTCSIALNQREDRAQPTGPGHLPAVADSARTGKVPEPGYRANVKVGRLGTKPLAR
jgi:hypothetical protein